MSFSLSQLFSSFTQQAPSGNKGAERKRRIQQLHQPALGIFTKASSVQAEQPLQRLSQFEKIELLKHSRLKEEQTGGYLKTCSEPLQILGQIHGDALAAGTSIESLPSYEGAKAWATILPSLSNMKVPQQLPTAVKQLSERSAELARIKNNIPELNALSKKTAQEIRNLKNGESYLLEGGYTCDKLQCPILFEFIKVSDNVYNLYVYVQGRSLSYRDQVAEGGETWNKSVFYFENVPGNSHLFFSENETSQSDFFQAILESRYTPKNPGYLALHLLAHLHPFRKDIDLFTSERTAATDAWSFLKPFLISKLGRDNYKKASLEIRLSTLIQGYQLLNASVPEEQAEALRIILKRGAQLVLKRLATLEREKTAFSDAYLLMARATAVDLLEELAKLEKAVEKSRKENVIPLSAPQPDPQAYADKYKEFVEKSKKEIKSAQRNYYRETIVSTRPRLMELPVPELFTQRLAELLNGFKQIVKNPTIQAAEIEYLIAQLPIPGDIFWDQLPKGEQPQILEQLGKLLTIYHEALKSHAVDGYMARERNTVYTLYAGIHFLSIQQDPLLSKYPLFVPGLPDDSDNYFVFTSYQEYQKQNELIAYFKKGYITPGHHPKPIFNLTNTEYWTGENAYEKFAPALLDYFLALAERSKDQFTDRQLYDFYFQTKQSYSKQLSQEQINGLPQSVKNAILAAGLAYNIEKLPATKQLFSLYRAALIVHPFAGISGVIFKPHVELTGEKKGTFEGFSLSIQFQDDRGYSLYGHSHTDRVQSYRLHPSLQGMGRDFRSLFDRTKPKVTTGKEGETLKSLDYSARQEGKEKLGSEFKSLLTAAHEPSLFPYRLLASYSSRLELFENIKEQTIFEISLFRSVALLDSRERKNDEYDDRLERIFPLAEELTQKNFQQQMFLFIKEGIDRFYYRQPNQRPKVTALCLFLRLAARLSTFPGGEMEIQVSELIEKMLTLPSLTAEERSLLSLHLVFAYSKINRELTQTEVEKAFGAWIYYKNTPLSSEQHNPLIEKEAEPLIHRASGSLPDGEDISFQKDLLKTALKQLGIELPSTYVVTAKESHLIEGRSGDDFWMVNLLTGEVMSKDGVLKYVQMPHHYENKHFESIFGTDFKSPCFQASEFYYYSHPQLGTFREQNSHYGESLKLQRQLEGQWCDWVPASDCLKSIPSFLCHEMTHWHNPASSEVLICARDSGKIIARVRDGKILAENTGELLWHVEEGTPFTTFEKPENIHWVRHPDGKTSLHFWRYRSSAHQRLAFDLVDDALVYRLNRKFKLNPAQHPGVLGSQNGALVLVHQDTGAKKVLVPLCPLAKPNPLTTHHGLNIPDFSWDGKNELEFLEYDLKDGRLTPLTQEGVFFLSYLNLSQRKYGDALKTFQQIDFRNTVSTSSHHILTLLIKSALTHDVSPEATAMALHAVAFLLKKNRRLHAEGKAQMDVPAYGPLIETYRRYIHQIPQELLLNTTDQDICNAKPDEKRTVMQFPDLQKFLPFPQQTQVEISELDSDLEYYASNLGNAEFARDAKITLNRTLYFLDEGKSPPIGFDEPIPLLKHWDRDFEIRFFRKAYAIAKNGSESERKQLAYRMQLIEIKDDQDKSIIPTSWKFLQLALKNPKQAPVLPPVNADVKAKLDFGIACQKLLPQEFQKTTRLAPEFKTVNALPRPFSAPIIPPKKVEDAATPSLALLPFSMEAIDQGFTESLFTAHFAETPKKIQDAIQPPSCPPLEALEDEEKPLFEYLKKEFGEFDKDFKKGAEINAERKHYAVKDVGQLKKKLVSEIETLDNQLVDLEASLLELANKQAPDDRPQSILKEAHIRQELSLKRLTDFFLQGDAGAFAKANPYLQDPRLISELADAYGLEKKQNLVIEYLYNKMGLYMALSVQKTRLTRAVQGCQKLENPALQGAAREAQIQKLAEELQPITTPSYSIKDYPLFLVYEYLSGFSIRAPQARLIAKLLEKDVNGNYISRVVQAIMGFGKTSLMAVILLKYAAKKGRLSLFITPASQYASVSYNLRKMVRDCFGIDMEEFDVTREQLSRSPHMCKEVHDRLEDASQSGNFLLSKAETILTVGLTFLDLIYQASKEERVPNELLARINTLKNTLLLLRKKGDAIFDEVDLLLHVLLEINFPVGEKKFISPERIEVIRALFLLLTNENVPLDDKKTINLAEQIGIRANRQNLMSPALWKTTIPKAIAYNFVRSMVSLKLSPDWQDNFERYLNGTMNILCQELLDQPVEDSVAIAALSPVDKRDYEFLKYVRKLRHSDIPAEREAAHQIALTKHMLQTVLPVNFENIGKRNYGRGGALPGEVRPYLAVDTPSDNLYGYHWEWLGFHFLTALQCGINKDQFLHLAKIYKDQAEKEAQNGKVIFEETLEAIEFIELTGVGLHELDDPAKIEEALRKLNENIEALLKLEADTAGEYVGYYPKRLTAPRRALISMLSTVRAMAGAPWNLPCYPKSLSQNFEPAAGTEGQIAELSLARASAKVAGKRYVHVTNSREIDKVLKTVLTNHPQRERVRALLDPGALFKDYTNLEVAKAIRAETNLPVLFFIRNQQKDEKTPDTLALLRLGSDIPEIIGGTQLKDIQKTGLDLEDYFVFDDERHTTGTDIPLPSDSVWLKTMDEEMMRRTFFQADTRAREFFLFQDVETIIPDYLLPILDKLIVAKGEENEDVKWLRACLVLSIKNQALILPDHVYRASKHEVDEVFRQLFWEEFIIDGELTHDYIRRHFPAHEKTLVIEQEDLPYDQFGALETTVTAAKSLENHKQHKLEQFPTDHPKRKGNDGIVARAHNAVREAKESPYLVGKVSERASNIGMHVDVLVEVSSQVNQETDQQVEQKVVDELNTYNKIRPGNSLKETQWSDRDINDFLEKLRKGDKVRDLYDLSHLLSKKHFDYQHDYSRVFSAGIKGTLSWAYTTSDRLPVFHNLQRSLDQLLLVKKPTGGWEAIALAQSEASQFKRYLKAHPSPDVWLVQSDGSLFVDNPTGSFQPQQREIQAFLLECNVFNGRVDYLDAHEEAAVAWLQKEPSQMEIKKQFMKLRVAPNDFQNRLFYKSDVFIDSSVKENQRQFRWRLLAAEMDALSLEEIRAEKNPVKLRRYPPKQLNMLLPEQVALLGLGQIPYLTEPALIQAIPERFAYKMKDSQMKSIKEEQVTWFRGVAQIQKIPSRFLKKMLDDQLMHISPTQVGEIEDRDLINRLAKIDHKQLAHVTGRQVKKGIVDVSLIPHLRQKDAIEAVPTPSLHLVSVFLRKKWLTASQVEALDPKTQKTLIHELNSRQLAWLKTAEQMNEAQPGQIPGIEDKGTLERLGKVKNELLASVTGNQVKTKLIDEWMVPYLREQSAIGELPVEWLHHVNVTLRQKALTQPQVQRISYRNHLSLFQELTDAQLAWSSSYNAGDIQDKALFLRFVNACPEAKKQIRAEQIKEGYITEDMVADLPMYHATVESLPVAWLHHVKKEDRERYLSEAQVAALNPTTQGQLIEELTATQKGWYQTAQQARPKDPTPIAEAVPAVVPNPNVDAGAPEGSKPIVQIVLTTLALLVAAGLLVAGAFALMGAYWTHAPQFTVAIYHFFKSSTVISAVVLGGGTLMLVGLTVYAVHLCCRNNQKREPTEQ